MPIKRLAIDLPSGFNSTEAASFIAQLDNLNERMIRHLRGLSKGDLSWQIAPGMNTIGMLLAHVAINEAYWTRYVLEADPKADDYIEEILGIGPNADRMPIDSAGKPPEELNQELRYFEAILGKARTYVTRVAKTLSDADMEREIPVNAMVEEAVATPRWALYHILEHQAGHFGQMLQIKSRIEARAVEQIVAEPA